MDIVNVKIKDIKPDTNQPRKYFDEEKLKDLAKSIKKHGILSPVILQKTGQNYILIAGERRYRACKMLELDSIPAVIKQDGNCRIISLIENIQRENLTALEEAEAIYEIKTRNGYTQDETAKLIGKTRSYVANKLRLLSLDENTKNRLKDGKITEGHARTLLAEKDEAKREVLIDKILSGNLSVRATEKKAYKKDTQEMSELQDYLEDRLCTKVDIVPKKNGGTITIEYYSQDELKNIVEKISGE